MYEHLKDKMRIITVCVMSDTGADLAVEIPEKTMEKEAFYCDDIKSACEGLYEEFTKSIMESSDLDPINIVRHFGDLQKKWFSDVIE